MARPCERSRATWADRRMVCVAAAAACLFARALSASPAATPASRAATLDSSCVTSRSASHSAACLVCAQVSVWATRRGGGQNYDRPRPQGSCASPLMLTCSTSRWPTNGCASAFSMASLLLDTMLDSASRASSAHARP